MDENATKMVMHAHVPLMLPQKKFMIDPPSFSLVT